MSINIEKIDKNFAASPELEKRFPDRIKGIDASRSIDEIHDEIVMYIKGLLK